jgi:hypothetical protein
MMLSAEQHARIAAAYEKDAAAKGLSAEQRAELATKAGRFRYLAEAAADIAAGRSPRPTGAHFQLMSIVEERLDDLPRYERRVTRQRYLRDMGSLISRARAVRQ